MALSDVKVRTAKPEEKAYKLTDGDGIVQCCWFTWTVQKHWCLRYRFEDNEEMLMWGIYH